MAQDQDKNTNYFAKLTLAGILAASTMGCNTTYKNQEQAKSLSTGSATHETTLGGSPSVPQSSQKQQALGEPNALATFLDTVDLIGKITVAFAKGRNSPPTQPDDSEVNLYSLMHQLLHEEKYRDALATCEQTIKKFFDNTWYNETYSSDLIYTQGDLLRKLGRKEESAKVFQDLMNRDKAKGLCGLANLCADSGAYAEAEEKYKQAIKEDPQFTNSYNSLGKLYLEKGRFNEAKISLNAGLKIDAEIPEEVRRAAWSYLGQGDVTSARSVLLHCGRTGSDPIAPDLYNNLAKVYLAQRDFGKARVLCSAALDLAPTFADAKRTMEQIQKSKTTK